MNDEQLYQLFQDIEDALVDDSPERAAEGLLQLAQTWANAGMPKQSFNDMRKHIVERAENRTSTAFIKEKLERAEAIMRKQRDDRDNNTHRIHLH